MVAQKKTRNELCILLGIKVKHTQDPCVSLQHVICKEELYLKCEQSIF